MSVFNLAGLSADELHQYMREHMPELAQQAPPPPTKRKIVVGLLCYQSTGYWRCFMSLMKAVTDCAKEGWDFAYIMREGDSQVARARSFVASQFLERPEMKDATDLVFVDVDLAWEDGEFVRLCRHPVDVVGGAYPFKDDTGKFPLRWLPQGLQETNGLWQMMSVTPGFFRITRTALERMANELPHLKYHEALAKDGQRTWMFFDNLQRSNGVWDEGYIFCERWRSIGGTVWLDPDLKLYHIGPKAYEHGTIRGWVDKKAANTEKLIHEFPHIPPLQLIEKEMRRPENVPFGPPEIMATDVDPPLPEPPAPHLVPVAPGEAA